jgi:hypothetical protein
MAAAEVLKVLKVEELGLGWKYLDADAVNVRVRDERMECIFFFRALCLVASPHGFDGGV